MEKALDRKLARILADPSCGDFIIADAKDADTARGLSATGRSPEHHGHGARFRTLDEYRQLMREITELLEVFDPNAPGNHPPPDVGRFVNDQIVRTLAGVTSSGRPIFLKIPYHVPAAMESLANYDKSLIVGIMGGPSGTTFDAYQMLWEAKKYVARVALFGRKINDSENQLSFVKYLRAVADDQLGPEEAVRAYHGDLQKLGVTPYRTLEEDLSKTDTPVS